MNILSRFEEREPLDLSESGIRDLLSGNLCRCTGYINIIAAVKRAAELLGRGLTDNLYVDTHLRRPH